MKISFPSKSLSILGIMTAIAVIVGAGVQQTVKAQAQAPAASQGNANLTIAEIVAKSGGEYDNNNQDFDILLNALKETELVDALKASDANLTVFAPTDEAFIKYARFFGYDGNDEASAVKTIKQELAELSRTQPGISGVGDGSYNLKDILLYHLSLGTKGSAELQSLTGTCRLLETRLAGFPKWLEISYINGSFGDASLLSIAPTLVPSLTDISASNGIIHGIDNVLSPYYIEGKEPPRPTPQAGQPVTIADMIAQSGEFDDNDQDFDILFKLIKTAGLTEALADPNADLTLFAPTDAAFMRLARVATGNSPDADFPENNAEGESLTYGSLVSDLGVIDQIIRKLPLSFGSDAVPLLEIALKYHVSAGAKTVAEIQAAPSINTLLEGSAITPKDGKLMDLVGNPDYSDPQFQAGKTDITASNGVIHGIDEVLLPNFFPTPAIGENMQPPAEAQAVETSQRNAGATNSGPTIAEIVAKSGGQYDNNNQDFDILLNALKETDLVGALEAADANVTVFAPTDEAFIQLARYFGYGGNDESTAIDTIKRELDKLNSIEGVNSGGFNSSFSLKDILLYHLSEGVKTSEKLQSATGSCKLIEVVPDGVEGGPLIPYNNGSLGDGAMDMAAPNLVTGLTDISASNGIIHGIDRVLIPYGSLYRYNYPISTRPMPQAGQPVTLVDMIAKSGDFDNNDQDFDILFKLITTAGLTDALADPNANLTLFAPNDAAFMKFAEITMGESGNLRDEEASEKDAYGEILVNILQSIDANNNQTGGYGGDAIPILQPLLKYHVSPGAKTAAEVQAATSISTLLEGSAITPKDGKLVDIEDAAEYSNPQLQAGQTDMTASNGVIHTIDNVLLPKLSDRELADIY
jgi:serralysin